MENKTGKYLKYAIGEIVLVVIGILLAVQINTWSNENIAKNNLKEIYKQIKTDLKADTTRTGQIIMRYKEKDKRILDIMNNKIKPSFYDTINSLNFNDCSVCSIESTKYDVFIPLTKGYNLLKNTGVTTTFTKDSLPNIINDFYLQTIRVIEGTSLNLGSITYENIKDNQQYSWFSDWSQRKYNKDFLIYLFESDAYRKQLGRYRIYAKYNYIFRLENHKKYATDILARVELELESK